MAIRWIGKPPKPRGKIYKYVNAEHAEFLERGSLRVGTLRSYSALENRSDPLEGTLLLRMNSIYIGGAHENIREREALKRIGLNVDAAEYNLFYGICVSREVEPLFCVCFSLYRNNAFLQRDKEQAIFEINDICGLLDAVNAEYRLGIGYAGNIIYTFDELDYLENIDKPPHPFEKRAVRDDGYESYKEREFRYIYRSNGDRPVEPFNGQDSLSVARFLKRIK
jgi:hypothetical protein